jgi:hypothetical protein
MDYARLSMCVGLMAISVIAAFFLFRKEPRNTLLQRGPLFIECFLLFFCLGLALLPEAVPKVFERILGHTVWAVYAYPVQPNGTQVSGTWWVERWLNPLRTGYFCLVLLGMLWAVINLLGRREWKINSAALLCGVAMLIASIYVSLTCFPFCF